LSPPPLGGALPLLRTAGVVFVLPITPTFAATAPQSFARGGKAFGKPYKGLPENGVSEVMLVGD
jgi:hypothetical protein